MSLMLYGTYVGRIKKLRGRKALLMVKEGDPTKNYMAQFDKASHQLMHNWHEFKQSDFKLESCYD